MSGLNIHKGEQLSPPPRIPTAITKAKEAYAYWVVIMVNITKTMRMGIGAKIDNHFLVLLELLWDATYSKREKKQEIIIQAQQKLDYIKWLLQIMWENRCIANNQYERLSEILFALGKMLGGWQKFLEQKTPAIEARENNEFPKIT